jgi:type I restriction enzyme S subunit
LFFYYWLSSSKIQDRISSVAEGTTGLGNMDTRNFRSMYLKYPEDIKIQENIANILSLVDTNIEQTKKVIEKAEKLKKSMMQNLLTGKMKPDGTYREKVELEILNLENVSMKPLQKFIKLEKPKDWGFVPLRKIINLVYGEGLGEKNIVERKYPVFGSNGITAFHNDYVVEGPGIIIGRKGTVGSVKWSENNFYPIDTTYYIKLKEELNLRWVYYVLLYTDLLRLNAATGVPGLNRRDALSMYVFKPSKNEQDEIVNKIETTNHKIKTNKLKLQKLERLKKSLMQNLLTGKMEVPENLTIKQEVLA